MLQRRALLGAAGAVAVVAPVDAKPTRTLEGQPPLPKPLPQLAGVMLKDLEGRPAALGQLIGPGRAAVVSFWATWCAPCAAEGQHLARLRAQYPEDRLAIVGVNVDAEADPERQARFRAKAKMTYPQAIDGRVAYVAFAGTAAIALPRAYVFDARGRPVAAFGRFFGRRSLDAISEAVRTAVASSGAEATSAG